MVEFKQWAFEHHHPEVFADACAQSYADPDTFWPMCRAAVEEECALSLQSSLFSSYNLYHDCIVQHLGRKNVAFKCFTEEGWREWSYEKLHRLVNYQVNRWKLHDFEEKTPVAIVMPLGINCLISLLMVIRLGLPFTLLPTDSPLLPSGRIRSLLDRLQLSVVMTTPEVSPLIPGDEKHWLIEYLEEREEYDAAQDYIYEPDEVAQQAVACHLQEEYPLVPLTAQEIYLAALRDGFLTFGLRPGTTWAYAPNCSLREQPFSLLTSLLYGATTLLLPEEKLKEEPECVESFPIDILGVTEGLRDLWIKEHSLPKQRLKLWYQHPFEDNLLRWEEFTQENKLQKVLNRRLLIDNAQTGVMFTSYALSNVGRDPLWPSPGTPWGLFNPNQQELPAVFPFGVFQQQRLTHFLLTELGIGYELGETLTPSRKGYHIPLTSLEEAASALEYVEKSVLLTLPTPKSPLNPRLVLLVFLDPFKRDELEGRQEEWQREIKANIQQSIGPLFLPDQIEFYPFLPKCKEDEVDRSWCQFQYTNGVLGRKREIAAYHILSLMRKSLE